MAPHKRQDHIAQAPVPPLFSIILPLFPIIPHYSASFMGGEPGSDRVNTPPPAPSSSTKLELHCVSGLTCVAHPYGGAVGQAQCSNFGSYSDDTMEHMERCTLILCGTHALIPEERCLLVRFVSLTRTRVG